MSNTFGWYRAAKICGNAHFVEAVWVIASRSTYVSSSTLDRRAGI
jgi:hypothetical protein